MKYEDSRQRGNAKVKREALELAIEFSGLSQAEIARRAGVSPQQISNLLHSRDYCQAKTAAKISRVFEKPTERFFVLNVFDDLRTENTRKQAA